MVPASKDCPTLLLHLPPLVKLGNGTQTKEAHGRLVAARIPLLIQFMPPSSLTVSYYVARDHLADRSVVPASKDYPTLPPNLLS